MDKPGQYQYLLGQGFRPGYLDNRLAEVPFRVLVDHYSNIAKTGDQ